MGSYHVSMSTEPEQRFTFRLPTELIAYLTAYQKAHGLRSRSEAVEHAIEALKEKKWAEEYAAYARSGEFVDLTNADGLEPSDGSEWLTAQQEDQTLNDALGGAPEELLFERDPEAVPTVHLD